MAMKTARKRTYRKATRKNKNGQRRYVDLKKQHSDPRLRQQWDNTQTVTKNMSRIQLCSVATKACTADVAPPLLPTLSERESFVVRELLKKYEADDFEKMYRDKKNVYQWTAAVLEKKVALYRKNLVCGTAREFLAKGDCAPP